MSGIILVWQVLDSYTFGKCNYYSASKRDEVLRGRLLLLNTAEERANRSSCGGKLPLPYFSRWFSGNSLVSLHAHTHHIIHILNTFPQEFMFALCYAICVFLTDCSHSLFPPLFSQGFPHYMHLKKPSPFWHRSTWQSHQHKGGMCVGFIIK